MSASARSLLAALAVTALVSCRPPGNRDNVECRDDEDCSGDKPYCAQKTNICVACTKTDQCDCHEICADEICVALGADDPAQANNAHGMWEGVPGQPAYTYKGVCLSDDQCDIGQICNPLTGGCIVA